MLNDLANISSFWVWSEVWGAESAGYYACRGAGAVQDWCRECRSGAGRCRAVRGGAGGLHHHLHLSKHKNTTTLYVFSARLAAMLIQLRCRTIVPLHTSHSLLCARGVFTPSQSGMPRGDSRLLIPPSDGDPPVGTSSLPLHVETSDCSRACISLNSSQSAHVDRVLIMMY